MGIQFCRYTDQPGYTDDFYRVCEFLIRVNCGERKQYGMLWVRWEWAFAKGIQDKVTYEKIGMWKSGDDIVALAIYEEQLGKAWLIVDPTYEALKPEMLRYARQNLHLDGKLHISIDDNDRAFQRAAYQQGFRATQDKEQTAALELVDEALHYQVPNKYRVVSFADEFDMRKYNRVMWLGFDHTEPVAEDDQLLEWRRNCVTSPHSNLELLIAIVAPDGTFAAHCGMWYQAGTDYAVVEPVATQPDYRRLGLGKAAVLEAARRCRQLGAKRAYVDSSQQFYYDMGFSPCSNETFWGQCI
jgi:GNAT superfamily N-acetyltransferase